MNEWMNKWNDWEVRIAVEIGNCNCVALTVGGTTSLAVMSKGTNYPVTQCQDF